MRALTERQAKKCEEAREHACRCRCRGLLHGANRAAGKDITRAFFEGLPEGDPHHVPSRKTTRKAKPRGSRHQANEEQPQTDMLF